MEIMIIIGMIVPVTIMCTFWLCQALCLILSCVIPFYLLDCPVRSILLLALLYRRNKLQLREVK